MGCHGRLSVEMELTSLEDFGAKGIGWTELGSMLQLRFSSNLTERQKMDSFLAEQGAHQEQSESTNYLFTVKLLFILQIVCIGMPV